MNLRKTILIALACTLFMPYTYSQNNVQPSSNRLDWWRNARFGMFIHWGLYAVPAGEWNGKTGYGEWIRNSAEIPLDTYDHFREQFNPVKFNAEDWVKQAKDAGMKYIVITAKHHDGFCMFDTKQTDFNIMNTPFHHDPMKDLAAACKKYDLKFCFYYSIMDWHHPDYTPRREWEKDRPVKDADFRRYVDYMKAEMKELLTNYGEIGILWFDGEWENTWNGELGKEIYDYCRTLQPNLIINNRVSAEDLGFNGEEGEEMSGGDYQTPEQKIPDKGLPGQDWETCMTMNDHWGYNKNDKNFKSTGELLRMITDIASKGGNYLLNVGPTAEGLFPPESVERLNAIGQWMKDNGEAIHGTKASPFGSLPWGKCTWKAIPEGTRLYLHVLNPPKNHKIIIPGCLNEPLRVNFLSTRQVGPIVATRKKKVLQVALTGIPADSVNTVIVLDLKGKLDLYQPPDFKPEVGEFIDTAEVELISSRENVSIRYTLDGTKPTKKSPLYTAPVKFTNSTTIKTRCFREDKTVSGIARKDYIRTAPQPAVFMNEILKNRLNLSPGLEYYYYEGKWDSIPDFQKSEAKNKGVSEDFSLEPKLQDDQFGFRFTGVIIIPETDIYTFYTESDDGSALYIDGKKIVDNDGLHGKTEKQGHIALQMGFHYLTVDYFEHDGAENLKVSWSCEEVKKEKIPEDILFH